MQNREPSKPKTIIMVKPKVIKNKDLDTRASCGLRVVINLDIIAYISPSVNNFIKWIVIWLSIFAY